MDKIFINDFLLPILEVSTYTQTDTEGNKDSQKVIHKISRNIRIGES